MKNQKGFLHVLDFTSEWPGVLAVIAMLALVFTGVIGRFINYPLHFVEEYCGYLEAGLIFLPLSFVLRRAEHIRLDILVDHFPHRIKKFFESGNLIISLGVILVLAIGVTQLIVGSFLTGRRAYSVMETPLWPVQSVILAGLVLFAIQIVMKIKETLKDKDPHRE